MQEDITQNLPIFRARREEEADCTRFLVFLSQPTTTSHYNNNTAQKKSALDEFFQTILVAAAKPWLDFRTLHVLDWYL